MALDVYLHIDGINGFEFMRADGNGEPIKYYEVELENVIIASIAPSIEDGHILSESVGLKYSKIKWKVRHESRLSKLFPLPQ